MLNKIHYILIPACVALVGYLGSRFTNDGVNTWYTTINLPSWTPPGLVIGLVWTIIYILTAIAATLVWNRMQQGVRFAAVIGLFLANGFLNVFWSYLFFNQNLLLPAIFEAALLGLSVYAIMFLVWNRVRIAAYLLLPYALWVTFATYLTYSVWLLNK